MCVCGGDWWVRKLQTRKHSGPYHTLQAVVYKLNSRAPMPNVTWQCLVYIFRDENTNAQCNIAGCGVHVHRYTDRGPLQSRWTVLQEFLREGTYAEQVDARRE
jgi:hypothetical protein